MDHTKTAVYSRLAFADADRIAEQEQKLLRFAAENGHSDYVCYRDNGESRNTLDRPGMQELTKDIIGGRIGTVIILDISRISRSHILNFEWFQLIIEYGCSLKSVNNKSWLDMSNYPLARLICSL